MTKIPVLHMIDSLNMGGAERMAVNLVNSLVDSPYEPHLCITRQLGSLDDINSGISLLYLARKHRFDSRAFIKCLIYIRENRIKVVHAHSTSIIFGLMLSFFTPGIPVLWHIHGVEINKMIFYKKIFYRFAAQKAGGILCVSTELVSWVSSLKSSNSNIWYLPNFIYPVLTSPRHGENELITSNSFSVVCVSNLRNPKDHMTLLDAWKIVIQKFQKVHLLLIGGVGEKQYAQNIIQYLKEPIFESRVTWLGARADVPDLLRACQIGVLSSRSEGFPVTLLEYGRAKLGVVATDVGQCPEILDNGQAGILVPPGDVSAMADALIHLISDPLYCEKLGDSLYKYVEENYSQASVLPRLFKIYDQLLSGKNIKW